MKSLAPEPQPVVTSSYLRPLVSASILSEFTPEEEKRQIKRVFNLLDVRLLTEADLGWGARELKPMNYVLRFDSREILAVIAPADLTTRNRFRIEVYEQAGAERAGLLDTEIILPRKNIAVFGFESTDGTPYFLSFHVLPGEASKIIGVEGKVGGVEAVRAVGLIKPPRLVKKVDPIYPEIARQAGVEGVVILEAETDIRGNVVRVQVLRSIPLLDQAAVDALRQWKYEPVVIDGQPKGLIFTVTVAFRLKDKIQ
ncbi:MAG: energy transducer TonB [Candidatus Aminicenantes bacterium]|nr:energy transducer TonB [Candidatus Aminicenantes bacterium]